MGTGRVLPLALAVAGVFVQCCGGPCHGQTNLSGDTTVSKPVADGPKVIERADNEAFRKMERRIADVRKVCDQAKDVSLSGKIRVSKILAMLNTERTDPQPSLQGRHLVEDISCSVQRDLMFALTDVKDLDALQAAQLATTDQGVRDRITLAMSATELSKPDARQEAAMLEAIKVLKTSNDLSLRPVAAFALGNAAVRYPHLREKAVAALKNGLWVRDKANPRIKTSGRVSSDVTPAIASKGLKRWGVPVRKVDGEWVVDETTQ